MASAGGYPPFKQYRRQRRVQVSETNYNFGMRYTQEPLPIGACRRLVNVDIQDDGATLYPRSGLQQTAILTTEIPDTYNILDSTVISHKVGLIHQMMMGEPTETPALESQRSVVLGDGIMMQDRNSVVSYTDLNDPGATKIKLVKAESDLSDYNWKPVGCYAGNSSYLFFRYDLDGSNGTLCLLRPDDDTGVLSITELSPKALGPNEAVMWGYNMLSSAPYTFANGTGVMSVQLQGILPYASNAADADLVLMPRANQQLYLKCYYDAPAGDVNKFYFEWRDIIGTTWTPIGTVEDITSPNAVGVAFTSPAKDVIIRVKVYKKVGGVYPTDEDQVLAAGFSFDPTTYNTNNAEYATYDLTTGTRMVYWKNRIGIYGLPGTPNQLFLSEINDPTYFPYPHNVCIFDEPLIKLLNFGDALLAFTNKKLFMLNLSGDGLTWTTRMLQDNLNITEADIGFMQVIKNMVFFKSGAYFYMVVPSTTAVTGLTIAPISKYIKPVLENIASFTAEVLDDGYQLTDAFTQIYAHNYLDFEDIHNVFGFRPTDAARGDYIVNIDLLYNTILRTWRVYVYESEHIIFNHSLDATQRGTFITKKIENSLVKIRYLRYNELNPDINDFIGTHIKNYQLIDTGNRDLDPMFKKRFREVQFQITNPYQQALRFSTDFLVDGATRKDAKRYEVQQILDPEDPDYGQLIIEEVIADYQEVPGVTRLAPESVISDSFWTLGFSQFPEVANWKIRVQVTGKGYAPQLIIRSLNEQRFGILANGWVYVPKNSR